MLKMKFSITLIMLSSILLISCTKRTKIACIGDSITNGGGKNHIASSYPYQLGFILGEDYKVLNCGENGATMQTDGNKPYWDQKDLSNVFVYEPDLVIIMLGTNDSKTENWNSTSFKRDYQLLIDSLLTLKSNPIIYLCSPPPAYSSAWNINDSTIQNGVIPIVKQLAKTNKLEVIDVYNGMTNMSQSFPDGIHPDHKAVKILAKIISEGIR